MNIHDLDALFKVSLEAWLSFWLPRDVRAYLSDSWKQAGHPSIVPSDKFKKF
jgi:hypothetical protein